MENVDIKIPKAFISYSWSSNEHEKWVINLATELRESNVDVSLDKWDLREGADKYKFMEQMVTNPDVNKVIIISDKIYSEKADGRMGGVGTETVIISQEIYNQLDSTSQKQKFVAVITEKDENDKPYLPTFLKSRIYIDFTDESNYSESFEQLVRWLFDIPFHKKPRLGKTPSYITNDDEIQLGTTSRYKLAVNAIVKNKENAFGLCSDYFDHFAESLIKFTIPEKWEGELDDQVIESIKQFKPYRDEVIDLICKIAKYYADAEIYEHIHHFLEKIIPYAFWPKGVQTFVNERIDNYRFFIHEIYLYIIAVLINYERFNETNVLIEQGYYLVPGLTNIEGGLYSFVIFRTFMSSIEHRNHRLKLRRISIRSDLLVERATRKDINLMDLMQADYILFLRSELVENGFLDRWFPHTLLYVKFRRPKFEKFLRAKSKKYFDKFKVALGVNSLDEFIALLTEFKELKRNILEWHEESLNPGYIINLDELASRP